MTDAVTTAEGHIVTGEGAVQARLDNIDKNLADLTALVRKHCDDSIAADKRAVVVEDRQARVMEDLDALDEKVRDKADKAELNEIRALIHNPWAIALGSGATVGIIWQFLPKLLNIIGGP